MARLLRPLRQQSTASNSNFRSCKEEWPACYDRRDNELPRPILIFAAAKKNGPTAADVAATSSASDSILRCREEKWPACYDRCGSDLPRPILFFVAAKKNGPPADRRRKARAASIHDFKPRLADRRSVIAATVKNGPPAAQSWGAGGDRMPRRRHNPK